MNLPSPDNQPTTTLAAPVEGGDELVVTTPRTRKPKAKPQPLLKATPVKEQLPPPPTGKIFLGEQEKRLLKKFNDHIVKKLGLESNRSYKV